MSMLTRAVPLTGAQLPPHKVSIESVDLTTLQVSLAPGVRTQREATTERIKKLKGGWDTNAAGTIIINRRSAADGGGDYVVDGWGRTCTAKELGIKTLRAEVHHGLSIPDEAKLFRIKNKDIKQVSVLDNYLVGLTEGDADCINTQAVLKKHGLTMGGNGPDNVGSVAAILKVTKDHGASNLDLAMLVAEATWGRTATTWDGSIIAGLAKFFAMHGTMVKPTEVVTKFQARWPAALLAKGDVQQVATFGGSHYDGSAGRVSAAYRLFVNEYNKKRQKRNRLALA